jgi:hypothetical protein
MGPKPKSSSSHRKTILPRASKTRGSGTATVAHATALLAANDLEPVVPYPGTQVPWKCRCLRCGSIASPAIRHLKNGRRSCATCFQAQIVEAARSEFLNVGLEPVGPYRSATKGWKSRCMSCGDTVSPIPSQIHYYKRYSCGGCRRIDQGAAAVDLLAQHDIETLEPYKGSDARMKCKCLRCGSIILVRPAGLKSEGKRSCQTCASRATSVRHKMSHEQALVLLREHDITPLEAYPGSTTKWRCRCDRCGSEIILLYANLQTLGLRSCWTCKHNQAVVPEHVAQALFEASDLAPVGPYPGAASKPWKYKCKRCGTRSEVPYAVLRRGSRRCHGCNRRGGLTDDEAGIVYLVKHEELASLKVGIARLGSERLKDHNRNGWEVVAKHQLDTIKSARMIERAMITHWRNKGFAPSVLPQCMPQAGATETVSMGQVSVTAAKSYLTRLVNIHS